MEAITYLEQIKKYEAAIEVQEDELESLETLRDKITASYDGERVQTSGSPKKLENCVIRIMQLKEEYAESIINLQNYRNEALILIKLSCDADCIRLLYKRYFAHMDWGDIASDMNYTYHWVSNGLHKRALSQVQKALDERERNGGVTNELP